MLGARFSKEVFALGLAVGLALALIDPLTRMLSDGPSSWLATATLPPRLPLDTAASYNLNFVPYGIDRGFCNRASVTQDLKRDLVQAASLLVDSTIGAKMDEADQQCVSSVLEYAPDRRQILWRNSNSGLTYTVIATQTYQTDRGVYCRDYRAHTTINGQPQDVEERACRQPSGTWSVVR